MKIMLTMASFCIAIFIVFAVQPRVASPDGKSIAIATYPAYESWIPRFPGSSDDKRGRIAIYTKGGHKIGQANVDMVSIISDIRRSSDSVEIPVVASWRLSK
jgi:hypothetical protein